MSQANLRLTGSKIYIFHGLAISIPLINKSSQANIALIAIEIAMGYDKYYLCAP